MSYKLKARRDYRYKGKLYRYNGIRNNQGLRLWNIETGKVIYVRIANLALIRDYR